MLRAGRAVRLQPATTSTTSARRPCPNYPSGANPPETGQSAIGQFEVQATPLQMAMVVAGIANQGTVMRPYLVDEVQSPTFEVLEQTQPEELSEAVSASTADQLTDLMVYTVERRHREPGRHQRHHGGRQDGHRAERQPRRPALRLVRLVRAGRRTPRSRWQS